VKSDREFLDGMWKKVSLMEYERMQKRAAEIRHRNIMVVNAAGYMGVIAVIVLLLVNVPSLFVVYIAGLFLSVFAYGIDMLISGDEFTWKKFTLGEKYP